MKIKNVISLLLLGSSAIAFSQSDLGSVLKMVEQNNTTLKALRKTADAQKLGNRTDIYLDGPEIEGGYLWGKPSDIGNRTDFSISQTFDFPTLTGMRGRYANQQNKSVELQYLAGRRDLLLEAKLICLDVIYYNLLQKEHERRLANVSELAEIYRKRLATGDANRIEYNNVRVGQATVEGEKHLVDVAREGALASLKRINGGEEISLDAVSYPADMLALTFDELYAKAEQVSPELAFYRQEEENERDMLKINRAGNLPSVTAGYMSEKVGSEHFQGIKMGVALPLWSNKNKVAQSKAMIVAAEARTFDARQAYSVKTKQLFDKAVSLRSLMVKYKDVMRESDNKELLVKALKAGEISLSDYLAEIAVYYDLIDKIFETELEYHKTVAELTSFEL